MRTADRRAGGRGRHRGCAPYTATAGWAGAGSGGPGAHTRCMLSWRSPRPVSGQVCRAGLTTPDSSFKWASSIPLARVARAANAAAATGEPSIGGVPTRRPQATHFRRSGRGPFGYACRSFRPGSASDSPRSPPRGEPLPARSGLRAPRPDTPSRWLHPGQPGPAAAQGVGAYGGRRAGVRPRGARAGGAASVREGRGALRRGIVPQAADGGAGEAGQALCGPGAQQRRAGSPGAAGHGRRGLGCAV